MIDDRDEYNKRIIIFVMKKLSKYLLWAFGVAWIFQIIAGILYRKGNSMSYSVLLAVSMFAPLFAAVLSGTEIRIWICSRNNFMSFSNCDMVFCSLDGKPIRAMEGFSVNVDMPLEALDKEQIRSVLSSVENRQKTTFLTARK